MSTDVELPFQPESMESARKRLPQALEQVFLIADVVGGDRASSFRAHVFDFDDGVRLIISRDELYAGHRPQVHVSASLHAIGEWQEKARPIYEGGAQAFLRLIADRWHELGRAGSLKLIGCSEHGVPHFIEVIGYMN